MDILNRRLWRAAHDLEPEPRLMRLRLYLYPRVGTRDMTPLIAIMIMINALAPRL